MKIIMIVDEKLSAQRLIADYLTANNGREALYVYRMTHAASAVFHS